MISILIPNFNYDCQDLIFKLVEERNKISTPIEICIGDDASSHSTATQNYSKLKALSGVKIIKNKVNLGREKNAFYSG